MSIVLNLVGTLENTNVTAEDLKVNGTELCGSMYVYWPWNGLSQYYDLLLLSTFLSTLLLLVGY